MQQNRHFIGKQFVEFTLPNGVDGKSWLDKVSKFSNGHLNPAMEKLFDRYADQDTLIQIEKLEVDIGEININTPDDELTVLVANQLEEQLYSLIALNNTFVKGKDVHVTRQEIGKSIFDQWLHYLEYGIMPWQAETIKESELQEMVLSSLAHQTGAGNKFRMLLIDKTQAIDRLILQHTDHFIELVLEAFTAKKQLFLIQLLEELLTLEQRWIRKTDNIRGKKYPILVLPLRLHFWRYIIQNFISNINSGFNIQHARNLVKKLFLTGGYEGMPEYIVAELKNYKSDYPVLKGLPEGILKDASRTIKNDYGINEIVVGEKTPDDNALEDKALSDLDKPDEQDKPSKARKKQIEKKQKDIKPEPEDADLALSQGETKKPEESANKEHGKKEHEKNVRAKDEEDIIDIPLDRKDLKSDIEDADFTSIQGEIEKSKESDDKAYGIKKQKKSAESKHEEDNVDIPVEGPDKYSTQDVLNSSDIDTGTGIGTDPSTDSNIGTETDITIKEKTKPGKEDYFLKDKLQFNAIKKGEVIYVQQAGIVLLNPFLNNFLKKLNIVKENIFVDYQSQQKAIHLIHYLSSGKTGLPEYEMILAKLLCGLPFSSPIERNIKLTKMELNEAENLLKAAIEHWGALGNSSPAALREGFLQREGKLEKVDNGWRLYVEQKTIDILLRKLPLGWGLGAIKLPWMEEILHVEWG